MSEIIHHFAGSAISAVGLAIALRLTMNGHNWRAMLYLAISSAGFGFTFGVNFASFVRGVTP